MHTAVDDSRSKPAALALLASERPRNVGWLQAAGLLFGDWGTSRLYVLGLAFFFAGRTSFWLICAMSLLILAVGWAYTQICRIYPDGGGVYTASRSKSKTLAVIGALLLFADYTVTASLSSLDAFHYFGLPLQRHVAVEHANAAANAAEAGKPIAPPAVEPPVKDAGDQIHGPDDKPADQTPEEKALEQRASELFHWDSPGLWAIISILILGAVNLLGPKHSGGFAIAAAIGMVAITLIILGGAFAVPGKMHWHDLPHRVGHLNHSFGHMWVAFVSIVLALSGVEAIANLTGVMKKPVVQTAGRAIWVVALEVAIFNILLALCMSNIFPLSGTEHQADMLAFLSKHYTGSWGEWAVRIIGGTLLLSAVNTAINGLMSIVYVISRDNELPAIFQKVNRFGAPWVAAVLATTVPALILVITHQIDTLASLYAIGVIGAISINVTLCAIHPRLRRMWRKVPMLLLGVVLLAIWVTLAYVKREALLFVSVVMVLGLTARQFTKWFNKRRGPQPSLLRRAIVEQWPADAMHMPKILVGTYGSDALAQRAFEAAKREQSALVVCFIRQVALSYEWDRQMTIDSDLAAQRTFARYLELGHKNGVPVIPVYDMGNNAAELMAENAAIYGCSKVLIGSSRHGALYHIVRGRFQENLEGLLPPEIPVQVVRPEENN
jgi:amino acid transporter